ncbi:hypothetical protein Back11_35820 [Paenibacillus baekrokdamisoli]|uniref:Copper amine oxidase-like N-terminal domain-containing protein n=1 Tax=Paenibacillus baekrokdamisoli TaxID=1712516 RepID=A0A3G9ITN9_9BACL|nr:stalk domain-containing protein [Paenibacillus baekrokdamisoli]MBB3070825.1 hypothetical protein [Paenibacillus baekrokdamisoli]BBH22237.1 hypothetical protein Back11_35820 [Paenibacillus baekrokdamisoli]
MKRIISSLAALCIVFAITGALSAPASAAAAAPKIVDRIGNNSILMDDGSLWIRNAKGDQHKFLNLIAIEGSDYEGLGLTRDGKVVSWSYKEEPGLIPGASNVVQITDSLWLKADGTVWGRSGQIESLDHIKRIGNGTYRITALSQNGDLMYKYNSDTRIIAQVADPSAIVKMEGSYSQHALLDSSGKVIIYDTLHMNFDINKPIPETVAEDAIDIVYIPSGNLLVLRKDGTVWATSGEEQDYTLFPVDGMNQVSQFAAGSDDNFFYTKRIDGTWMGYSDEKTKPSNAPSLQSVALTLSTLRPNVGDKVNVVAITENYSEDFKLQVPFNQANLVIQKPHLLKKQSDGTLLALGVGESNVTVISGGVSKTVTVSSSLKAPLSNAKQVNGTLFIPIKSVFQAIGGTVNFTPATKSFAIQVGQTSIVLKNGDANAIVNGKVLKMKAAPRLENGETLFPAAFLVDTLGAKLQWDSKWQTLNLFFGQAKMTIRSDKTAVMEKRAAVGNLTAFIGKTYWVNHFQGWDRFMKVTVVDIEPDYKGEFVIVFKTASNKIIRSSSVGKSYMEDVLPDSYFFLSYDPYKKYNWSSSVWQTIKAEKIAVGMTKEQVLLSWGKPDSTTSASSSGISVDVWEYSSYNYVAFTNGKVSQIYRY